MRPNGSTLGLGFVLLAMAYAGASQSNAAAYLLGFVTLSLALVSALHAWRNLYGLTVTTEPWDPVFAGESLPLCFLLRQTAGRRAVAISLSTPEETATTLVPEVPPAIPQRAELSIPAPVRGRFPSVTVQISSRFPLGFFTARRRLVLGQPYYVYPRPEGETPLPVDPAQAPAAPSGANPEGDDFAGVRDWRMGESMRHIDWKAAARGQRLMVKQWNGGVAAQLVLSWDALPGLEAEARLRQLARWVVLAARLDAAWELRLPGCPALGPERGVAHFHTCLRALAEWPGAKDTR